MAKSAIRGLLSSFTVGRFLRAALTPLRRAPRTWGLTASNSCVWQLLLAHFGGLIWPTLGRCRLGKAFALPSRKNKDRRRSCGNVGIPPLWQDFQGRGEEGETVLGFSTLSTARHFHS